MYSQFSLTDTNIRIILQSCIISVRPLIRSGGSTDFWTVVGYLPKETQNYMPAFLAILYAINYQKSIG